MIINRKYYVPPPEIIGTFKEVLIPLCSAGAGRIVNKDGFPEGPWSPELLATEISNIETNTVGIDLRSVQRWFQDAGHGIGHDNIQWLAIIFGCGDAEATRDWRVALMAAQQRLISERRIKAALKQKEELSNIFVAYNKRRSLPLIATKMFDNRYSLNLPIIVLAGFFNLCFLSFVIANHSISYSPMGFLNKQVGIFWSLSLPFECLVLYPILLFSIRSLVGSWVEQTRSSFVPFNHRSNSESMWLVKVENCGLIFWVPLLLCVVVIFGVQWGGVLLAGLLTEAPISVVDWILVARFRMDMVWIFEATLISMFVLVRR